MSIQLKATTDPHVLQGVNEQLPPPGVVEAWARQAVPTAFHPRRVWRGPDAFNWAVRGRLLQGWRGRTAPLLRQARKIQELHAPWKELDTESFQRRLNEVREEILRGKWTPESRMRALAGVAEATRRAVGMEPYPVQLAAAMGLLEKRCIELATGEGKTLVAALAATVAAWHCRSVHVLTANDYLAKRDAEWAKPIFRMAGLQVGVLEDDASPLEHDRAYRLPVLYGTQGQIAADVLRHRIGGMANPPPRGWVIVDEADALLVDESVTPLILSGSSSDRRRDAAIQQATQVGRQMREGVDYKAIIAHREIRLTRAGKGKLQALSEGLGDLWRSRRVAEELATQALTAEHFYTKDREYVVDEGKIVIVDAATGRPMPDRTWREGLHQAVEAKEGVEQSPLNPIMARISFQSFFRTYRHMSAMSGTCWEVRRELWQSYGILSVKIPRHRPNLRKDRPWRIHKTRAKKMARLVELVKQAHGTRRPVLVGTLSVESSEEIARLLLEQGIESKILNARHHAQEAELVAKAGQKDAVMIATNMAGRGTDIKLGPGVKELGGLLVIAAEPNPSQRVDRQLFGRSGRQGDPGEAHALGCLEDEVIRRHAPRFWRWLGGKTLSWAGRWGGNFLVARAQAKYEREGARSRKGVVRQDEEWHDMLGFAGKT